MGDPGVGKTLLARAIAKEANVNFLHCSGSDFDDKYYGMGAVKTKKLFKKARES
jgi:cell division protease FtsH